MCVLSCRIILSYSGLHGALHDCMAQNHLRVLVTEQSTFLTIKLKVTDSVIQVCVVTRRASLMKFYRVHLIIHSAHTGSGRGCSQTRCRTARKTQATLSLATRSGPCCEIMSHADKRGIARCRLASCAIHEQPPGVLSSPQEAAAINSPALGNTYGKVWYGVVCGSACHGSMHCLCRLRQLRSVVIKGQTLLLVSICRASWTRSRC